jgi:hypothetical protein
LRLLHYTIGGKSSTRERFGRLQEADKRVAASLTWCNHENASLRLDPAIDTLKNAKERAIDEQGTLLRYAAPRKTKAVMPVPMAQISMAQLTRCTQAAGLQALCSRGISSAIPVVSRPNPALASFTPPLTTLKGSAAPARRASIRVMTTHASAGAAAGALPSLVSPEWLQANLKDVKVLDGTWYLPNMGKDPLAEHKAERIPGAIFFGEVLPD